MSVKKQVEHIPGDVVVFNDYPVGKFARKVDWWTSPQGLELIAGWRQCGCSIDDITKKIGVDPRTFRAWRKKCPELEEILITGKDITNARVVDALYKRATGFTYDEVTRELVEGEMRVTKIVTKFVPPETKAILAWLYNRYPAEWRAIQQPIDTNTPALLNADNMLATIREVAEGVSDTLESSQNDEVGQMDSGDTEAKNDVKKDTGDKYHES